MVSVRSQKRRPTTLSRVMRAGGMPCLKAAAIFVLLLYISLFYHVFHLGAPSSSLKTHLYDMQPSTSADDDAHDVRQEPSSQGDIQDQNDEATTIAYAWSLTKCGTPQSTAQGMIDSALVLRHSIHLNSIRTPSSGSKYDYKMYVFVHPQAFQCINALEDSGYNVMLVQPPVDPANIQGDFLRKTIHRAWCCGSDEFIKLFAYTLVQHPVVVHVDIDFLFVKPMDDLIDGMLQRGVKRDEARASIITQYPNTTFPDKIEVFLTRDYHPVQPGQTPLFQAGLMVVRPDLEVFEEIKSVILEGDFREETGWGGKGYNNLVGDMAMQGLIAYYYDQIRPGVSVELHSCRYNYMGGANTYRGPPNFFPEDHPEWVGTCRSDGSMNCENCEHTDLELVHNIHYTTCRKPWNCIGEFLEEGDKIWQGIDARHSNFTHCMKLLRIWHEYRTDLEDKFLALAEAKEATALQVRMRNGTYKRETFMGHCNSNGQSGYAAMSNRDTYKLFSTLYSSS